MRDGFPIGMGYFAVSFSLGIIAAKAGLTAWMGFVGSFLTRASAGEYGVYSLIAIGASYVEVVAMCLVTNLRYLLMSTALTQKFASNVSLLKRILVACCVTDEIFGISIAYPGNLPPARPRCGHRERQWVLWQERFFLRTLLQLSAWHYMECSSPSSYHLRSATMR